MIAFLKFAFVIGMAALGWGMDGSYKGAVGMLGVMFVLWCIWELQDASWAGQYEAQARAIKNEFQIEQDFTDDPAGPSRRGHRLNPDPTRPTLDDYAGLITTYIERKRGN